LLIMGVSSTPLTSPYVIEAAMLVEEVFCTEIRLVLPLAGGNPPPAVAESVSPGPDRCWIATGRARRPGVPWSKPLAA